MLIILFMPEQRVYASDCEGPLSKNDNAFELTSEHIPNGGRFFSVISRYDDVEADVVKRSDYKAGDTLKLILPFLKAYEVTDKAMEDFSSENILLVPGAKDTLKQVSTFMPSFIVSTSYEHYIRSLCEKVDFPFENTYSTRLNIDNYMSSEDEKIKLRAIVKEVVEMPLMKIPESNSLQDFSEVDRRNIERLDEIFWKEIPQMEIGRVLKEVNPVGGFEKVNAVDEIVRKLGTKLSEVMYVGDSITDVDAFRKVRSAGGLTVSFNGNNYAIREAEVAALSGNTHIMSHIADVFSAGGKENAINWIDRLQVVVAYYEGRVKSNPNYFPQVEIIFPENKERLEKDSSAFRKTVRGEAVGKLG